MLLSSLAILLHPLSPRQLPDLTSCIMGSMGLRNWPRCPCCYASSWPSGHRSDTPWLCADCESNKKWEPYCHVMKVASKHNMLLQIFKLQWFKPQAIIREFLVISGRNIWSHHYLSWVLRSPGDLRRFTYFWGGMSGSVNQTTDILDLILAWVLAGTEQR